MVRQPQSDRIVKSGEILTTENLLDNPSGVPRTVSNAIAVVWLVSGLTFPVLGAFSAPLSTRLWVPSNRSGLIMMLSAVGATTVTSVLHLCGFAIPIAGVPLPQWAGLYFLIVVWCRFVAARTSDPT